MFQVSGKTIEFPGYLRAYVEGSDDPEAELADREEVLPQVAVGETLKCRRHGAEEPHHPAAQPLQRGRADPRPGGDGHRPAEHLRLDHRHDPGPRVRLQDQTRQRAGAHLGGLRRLATARGASARAGRLPVHRRDGGRAGRDQPRRDGPPRLPAAVLLRRRASGAEAAAARTRSDEIDARERLPDLDRQAAGHGPEAEEIFVRVGRYGPFLEQGERRASLPDKLPPDEVDASPPPWRCSTRPARATSRWASAPRPTSRCSSRWAASGRTCSAARPTTTRSRKTPRC